MDLFALYRDVFAGCTPPPAEGVVGKLVRYHEELVRWNRRVSLTALDDPEEIAVKLFYDSSVASPLLTPGETLLDVGTGAGFPGMVLALLRGDVRVTLAESRSKKVAFLKRVRFILGLENVEIWEGRVTPEGKGTTRFDVVTEKATAPPGEFLRLAEKYLKPGGRAILFSGVRGDIPPNYSLDREVVYGLPRGYGERVMRVYVLGKE